MIKSKGSVRADLLGGTLDLEPIDIILEKAIVLNCALSLKAEVFLEKGSSKGIEIVSQDYGTAQFFSRDDFVPEKLNQGHFKSMTFVAQILDYFKIHSQLKLTLKSGSPPGAGLGGSSTMGVTLFRALCEWSQRSFHKSQGIRVVRKIESRILGAGPTGYQDYYPALYGGILALVPGLEGVQIQQCYCHGLKKFLEEHLILVYSGESRSSGINNWEVYKSFFDRQIQVRKSLEAIGRLSDQAWKAVKEENFEMFIDLIREEGKRRQECFPGLVSSKMKSVFSDLKKAIPHIGMKVCGAGGGGCFLLTHTQGHREFIKEKLEKANMKVLDFIIESPLK